MCQPVLFEGDGLINLYGQYSLLDSVRLRHQYVVLVVVSASAPCNAHSRQWVLIRGELEIPKCFVICTDIKCRKS